RPSTASSYERNLRLHVLPTLGFKPLQAIRPSDLTTLYADLLTSGRLNGRGERCGTGLSVRSVQYVHTIVRACLQAAVDGDLLARNPADRATPPRPSSESAIVPIHAWTSDELRAFLERTAPQRHHVAWHVLAMTGMRRGEVLELTWSALDLDNGTLSVRRTLV